jgi:hypothetical protein
MVSLNDFRRLDGLIANIDAEWLRNPFICWKTTFREMLSIREVEFIMKTCAGCECCSRHKKNLFSGTNTDEIAICSAVPDLVIKTINRDGSPPGDGICDGCDCSCRYNFRHAVRVYSQTILKLEEEID